MSEQTSAKIPGISRETWDATGFLGDAPRSKRQGMTDEQKAWRAGAREHTRMAKTAIDDGFAHVAGWYAQASASCVFRAHPDLRVAPTVWDQLMSKERFTYRTKRIPFVVCKEER